MGPIGPIPSTENQYKVMCDQLGAMGRAIDGALSPIKATGGYVYEDGRILWRLSNPNAVATKAAINELQAATGLRVISEPGKLWFDTWRPAEDAIIRGTWVEVQRVILPPPTWQPKRS